MGQSHSIDEEFSGFFSQLSSDEALNNLLSEEIFNLTYEQFLVALKELNTLSKKCLDPNGKQLIFAVKKSSDSSVFWKATVQIACVKIDPQTQKVESYRFLSLAEFLKVFKTLKCQSSAAEQSRLSDELDTMEAFKAELNNLNARSGENTNPAECCICFERQQEIILPCTHSYCKHCIEEWGESHDTCPICREKIGDSEDSWVLSEIPKAEEIEKEIKENLMELTHHRSPPCSPS